MLSRLFIAYVKTATTKDKNIYVNNFLCIFLPTLFKKFQNYPVFI